MRFWKRGLPDEEVAELVRKAVMHQHLGALEKAWEEVAPLRRLLGRQRVAAQGLAMLLRGGAFSRRHSLELAGELLAARGREVWALAAIGDAAEVICDVGDLNAAPPDEPMFAEVAERLEQTLGELDGDEEINALEGLTTVARVLGRSWDEVTERAHRRLIELAPDGWQNHYNLGLFLKTRGRFAEGHAVNQQAIELGGGDNKGVRWNLGICATGAGDAEAALAAWKSLGQTIEMGCFDLPEGRYNPVKVRLAESPLAERAASDPRGPGREETVWIERLSPCHGVIRCALFQDLGIDYGDVVLFDGAAIESHDHGGGQVPVFPHLVTLSRQRYQLYDFAGTQRRADDIDALSGALSHDTVAYVHTERPGDQGHSVITGKLCAPPSIEADQLRAELDRALEGAAAVKLWVPDLSLAAGDADRADAEQKELAALVEPGAS